MNAKDQILDPSPTTKTPVDEAPVVRESSSVMDPLVDWVRDQLGEITSSPWGQAAIAMAAFILLAKLVEIGRAHV